MSQKARLVNAPFVIRLENSRMGQFVVREPVAVVTIPFGTHDIHGLNVD